MQTTTAKEQTIVTVTSQLEMLGFLKSNGTACRFVSMVSRTPVTKLKVGCPHRGDVYKVSRKTGMINVNYNASVCRRIAETLGVPLKDVEYEQGEVWYRHLMTDDGKALPVVVHKEKNDGKHYLQYYPRRSTFSYVTGDNQPIDEAVLRPFFYKESERPAWKPRVITVDLGNLVQLKASGVIMHTEEIEQAEKVLEAAQ